MKDPTYTGSPSAPLTQAQKGVLAMSLFGLGQPNYSGNPGGGNGGNNAPTVIKSITFAVLSPQLSSAPAENEQYALIARLGPRDNQQDGHSLFDVDTDEAIAAAASVDDDLSDTPF